MSGRGAARLLGVCVLMLSLFVGGCSREEMYTIRYELLNRTGGLLTLKYRDETRRGEEVILEILPGAVYTRGVAGSPDRIPPFVPAECLELINSGGANVIYCRNGDEPGNLLVPKEWERVGGETPEQITLRMMIDNERFAPRPAAN